MKEPSERQLKPDLRMWALLMLDDACPPEEHMQKCRMEEDDDGMSCHTCMSNYTDYIASGRRLDPYRNDRLHWCGTKF